MSAQQQDYEPQDLPIDPHVDLGDTTTDAVNDDTDDWEDYTGLSSVEAPTLTIVTDTVDTGDVEEFDFDNEPTLLAPASIFLVPDADEDDSDFDETPAAQVADTDEPEYSADHNQAEVPLLAPVTGVYDKTLPLLSKCLVEQIPAAMRYRKPHYDAAFRSAGLPLLDEWACEYLGKRGVEPAYAAYRGYTTGTGAKHLPPTDKTRNWSTNVKEWADGRYILVEALRNDKGKFAGFDEEPVQIPAQDWLIMPAYTVPGDRTTTVPQIRWRHERPVQKANEERRCVDVDNKKFDWPYFVHEDEAERALRAIDLLYFAEGDLYPVFLTEGDVKVDVLAGKGLENGGNIIGLPGIGMGYMGKGNGHNASDLRSTLLPEIRNVLGADLSKRVFVIFPDSDHKVTYEVMLAVVNTIDSLMRAGAGRVVVIDVPDSIVDPETGRVHDLAGSATGGVGVDDYAAARQEITPGVPWLADLIENAIEGTEYIRLATRYEDSDAGRGQRLADTVVASGKHLHITEGDKAEGAWFVHGTTHWHVDANRKYITRKAIDASHWIFSRNGKDATLGMRLHARSAACLGGAVTLAQTDYRLAQFSTIWEPMTHAKVTSCKNGVIDIRNEELLDHDPKLLNIHHAPVRYYPEATHKFWDEYKKGFFVTLGDDGEYHHDPELERMCMEVYGTGLMGMTFSTFVIMKGAGGCGMGTTIRAITQVLGDYAGTMKAADVCGDSNNFVASGIVHRRLVVSGEPNDGDKLDGAFVASLFQDGEDRDVEAKNKTAKSVRNTATGVIPTNHDLGLSASAEDNDALRRRARIAWFGRKIPDAEKSDHAQDMLATTEVQEAILADLVKHARAVIENNGQVYRSPASIKAVDEWITGKDRFGRFLDETTEDVKEGDAGFGDVDTGISTDILRFVYKAWCDKNEIPKEYQVKEINFKKKVVGVWGEDNRNRAKQRIFRGKRFALNDNGVSWGVAATGELSRR